jgi:hypothetical protein
MRPIKLEGAKAIFYWYNFLFRHKVTKSLPGSQKPGVPQSETKATR